MNKYLRIFLLIVIVAFSCLNMLLLRSFFRTLIPRFIRSQYNLLEYGSSMIMGFLSFVIVITFVPALIYQFKKLRKKDILWRNYSAETDIIDLELKERPNSFTTYGNLAHGYTFIAVGIFMITHLFIEYDNFTTRSYSNVLVFILILTACFIFGVLIIRDSILDRKKSFD